METTVLLFLESDTKSAELVQARLDRHLFLNPDLEDRVTVYNSNEHGTLASYYGVTDYPTILSVDENLEKLYSFSGTWNITTEVIRRFLNYGPLSKTSKRIS